MQSWQKFCPDYLIVEWNEKNFNIKECPQYVIDAYHRKKWAFVTDYVRLRVVYEYGGIYFDTDVELVKKIDFLLKYSAFFGFENKKYICAICAAPSILGHKGLLKGKEAICFPGFENDLTGAILSDKYVVTDGLIITARGAGVAIDFGLEIVKALKGEETAENVRKTIQCR